MALAETERKVPLVLIGIPSARTWQPQMGVALAALSAHSVLNGISVVCGGIQGCYVQDGRNGIAWYCNNNSNVDYLLFVDDDMEFPPDGLVRLMKHDKDVVGCIYVQKTPPHKIAGKPIGVSEGKDIPRSGLIKMEHVPTGFMLIKRNVFKEMRAPWFTSLWKREFIDEHSPDGHRGEDVNFCHRVRKELRKDVWADIDLSKEIRHIGTQIYQLDLNG